jgi:hypothetical protein
MINIAILGMDLRSRVRAGENAGRTLTHDFVALATAAAPMTADEGRFAASTPLPEVASGAGRHALVTWDAVAEA